MWHPFVSKQAGSSSLTALAAIVALSVATLYVGQANLKSKNNLDKARVDNQKFSARVGTVNALAQYKAMISPKAVGGGLYEPVLFPLNYFEGYWNLAKNTSIASDAITAIDRGNVSLKSLASSRDFGPDIDDLMLGTQKAFAKDINIQTVKFIRANFDKTTTNLVTSVDVEVLNNNVKTAARIPVPAPDAYNPVIQFSPAGAETWTTAPGALSGAYDIRVLGSGVVTVAKVMIGTAGPYELGGFDPKTGLVKHKATNVLARDVEIGRMTYNFDSGGVESYDYVVPDPKTSCKAVPVLSSTAGVDVEISVELLNPAETVSPLGKTRTTVKSKPAVPATAPGELPFEDLAKTCEKECKYIYPDNPADEGEAYMAKVDGIRANQVASKTFTDYSWGYMRHIRAETGVLDVKICENIGTSYKATLGTTDNIYMHFDQLEYVYYRSPSCERKFLFSRNDCGCFHEDTLITLGDGHTTKSIQDLTENDLVWNPILKRAQSIKRMTRGPEKIPLVKISSEGASVSVTVGHPFPTRTDGIRKASELKIGDEIRLGDSWKKIETVESVREAEDPIVWNLELDGATSDDGHFILANGIVTGDLKIQEQLAAP